MKTLIATTLATLAAAVLVAGCGGGGTGKVKASVKDDPASNEQALKALEDQFVQLVIDGNRGGACALTTKPGECLGDLALAEGFAGGQKGLAALMEAEKGSLKDAKANFVDDTHASLDYVSDGSMQHDYFVRRGDAWLFDWAKQESSTQESSTPTASQASAWAGKWCQVQIGMTLQQADAIMGEPTGTFPEQHQWEGFEWSFTAFVKSDGTIRQLDSDEEGSTPATSHVQCGEPVLGVPSSKSRR